MSAVFDNFVALKVLYMLVTPFEKTQAYKLGVIDKDGKLLVKTKDQTFDQKEAYDYLDRLVFNLKRLLAKVPGGKSFTASLVAALYLIKEDKMTASQLEVKFNDVLSKILNDNVTLVEESIIVEQFLKNLKEEDGGQGTGVGTAPANATSPAVSTDIPTIRKKKPVIAKRKLPLKV